MEQRINAFSREIRRVRELAATCQPGLKTEFLTIAKVMQDLVEELTELLHKESVE